MSESLWEKLRQLYKQGLRQVEESVLPERAGEHVQDQVNKVRLPGGLWCSVITLPLVVGRYGFDYNNLIYKLNRVAS